MKKLYASPTFSASKIDNIKKIIARYDGELCSNMQEANIIVLDQITYGIKFSRDYEKIKAKLIISYLCLQNMDFELMNPFTYKTSQKFLQNTYLRNKTFSFINTSDKTTKACTNIINSLDGKVVNENADYYLSELKEPCQGKTIISISWLYALQFSSCYLQPFLFIIEKKRNNEKEIHIEKKRNKVIKISTEKKTKSKSKSVLPFLCGFPPSINNITKIDDSKISLPKEISVSTDAFHNATNNEASIDAFLNATNNEAYKFTYDPIFISKAYHIKTQHKYSYTVLKEEMTYLYPSLKNESFDRFKDACKFCFSQLKAKKNMNVQFSKDTYSAFNSRIKEISEDLKRSDFDMMNKVQCGFFERKGPWCETEARHLKYVLIEGCHTGLIFTKEGFIDWVKIASFVPERTGKSIYDKYRTMVKNNEIEEIVNKYDNHPDSDKRFYKILHKALNSHQEKLIFNEIIESINKGEIIRVSDISIMARRMFYSPLSLATKAVVFSYLEKKQWPFDAQGDIDIDSFDEEVLKLIPFAKKDPIKLMKEYNIKEFNASLSWTYKFIHRNGLSFKKAHYERRGIINADEVDRYLEEVADAIITYGEQCVLNMDETCVNTFNPPDKGIAIRGKDTVNKVQIENYNKKEGTTYIGTISKDPNTRFPLCIIAAGTTQQCEKKFSIKKSADYCLHSKNGWTTKKVMIDYLNWLADQMEHKPFALILDVFRAHMDKTVQDEANRLNIKLIYVPSCGTGRFQPLDRSVYGAVKNKLKTKNVLSGNFKKRHSEIHQQMDEIWNDLTEKIIKTAWDIPNLNQYLYHDGDDPKDEDYIQ